MRSFIFLAALLVLASSGLAKSICSPKVIALATGIHLNIIGQGGELQGVKKLQSIESDTGVKDYSSKFELAKGELLSDIMGGINIRRFNQEIAPKDNDAVVAGLNTYASDQATELQLVQGLTGKPDHDKSVLSTLVSDVEQGTALNRRNLKAATKGCNLGFTFPSE